MATSAELRADIAKADGIIARLEKELKSDLSAQERETKQEQLDATIEGKNTLQMLLDKQGD